jgi:hypothetical protein
MGEPNPSNKIKHLRYIGLIRPRAQYDQISNIHDAGLLPLFTGYLKKQIMFASTFPKATITSTPDVHSSVATWFSGCDAEMAAVRARTKVLNLVCVLHLNLV